MDGRSLSYGRFQDAMLSRAAAFERLGVEAGDNVVTMLSDTVEAHLCWLALAWLGACEVPINSEYRGRMLRYVIAQSQARHVIMSARFLPRLDELGDSLDPAPTVIVPDADEVPPSPFEVICRGSFPSGSAPERLQPPEPAWGL